jgi:WD40 repeat protein
MRLAHPILAALLLSSGPLLTAAEPRPRLDADGDPLPPGAIARLGTTRFRVGGSALTVALSPDGKTAASLDRDNIAGENTLCLWDGAAGRLLHRFPAELGEGGSLVFSPDGKLLATFGLGTGVRLWDTASRKEVRRCRDEDGSHIVQLAFSPDGSLLAGAAKHGIRLWDPDTGKLIRRCGPQDDFRSVHFSPDGKALHSTLTFSSGGKTRDFVAKGPRTCQWEAATGKLLGRWQGEDQLVDYFLFSPDGKVLATMDLDGNTFLWDVSMGKRMRRIGPEKAFVHPRAFSADGKLLATDKERNVDIYDVATAEKVASCRGHHRPVTSVCFRADGKRLLSGSADGTLRLWDPTAGKPLQAEAGHIRDVRAVEFSPDGRTLASAGQDGTVRLWDVGVGRPLCVRSDDEGDVTSMSFAPDGKRLVSTGGNVSMVRVWTVTRERQLCPAWTHLDQVAQAVFSPDGKTVATATRAPAGEGKVCLWEAASGKLVRQWEANPKETKAIGYSADGKTLATAGPEDGVRIWEVATGRELQAWPEEARFYRIVASPDGRSWASAQEHGIVYLWDTASGKRLRRLSGNRALAFSPDGRLLATGERGRLKLYEAATSREVLRWVGQGDLDVLAVSFSPDGRRLASAGRAGGLMLWDLDLVIHGRPLVPTALTERELVSLWEALAGDDVRQAYRAIGMLAAAPTQSVPFLRQRLRPVRIDPERVQRLLAELDGDDFDARDRAWRQLAECAEVIAPTLRQTLRSEPSPEVRRRVEQLLARVELQVWTAEQVRQLRCLAVLERAGTSKARQLLQELAGGAERARLTQDACATLRRMDERARGRSPTKAGSCGEK